MSSRQGNKRKGVHQPAPIVKRDPTVLADPAGTPVFQVEARMFRGPLPPPEILAEYNDVVPGGADRIIRMAEEQSQHRRTLESKVVDSDISRSRWGLWLGFAIAVIVVLSGVYLVATGHSIEGLVLIFGDLATLAGVFVYGANNRKAERIEKTRIMTGQT